MSETKKYEAHVMRPFARYSDVQVFDSFGQAAEWIQGVVEQLRQIPKNLMEYSMKSMTIVEKTYGEQKVQSKTVWAELAQGLEGLSEMQENYIIK